MPNIKTITLIHAINDNRPSAREKNVTGSGSVSRRGSGLSASEYGKKKKWYQDHKGWKKDYNAKYYRQHKDQWKAYNQSRPTIGEYVSLSGASLNSQIDWDEEKKKVDDAYRRQDQNHAKVEVVSHVPQYVNSIPYGQTASREAFFDKIAADRKASDERKASKIWGEYLTAKRDYQFTQDRTKVTVTNFLKDAKNFGSNWKSGAKSIIDKGKSIFNKLFG